MDPLAHAPQPVPSIRALPSPFPATRPATQKVKQYCPRCTERKTSTNNNNKNNTTADNNNKNKNRAYKVRHFPDCVYEPPRVGLPRPYRRSRDQARRRISSASLARIYCAACLARKTGGGGGDGNGNPTGRRNARHKCPDCRRIRDGVAGNVEGEGEGSGQEESPGQEGSPGQEEGSGEGEGSGQGEGPEQGDGPGLGQVLELELLEMSSKEAAEWWKEEEASIGAVRPAADLTQTLAEAEAVSPGVEAMRWRRLNLPPPSPMLAGAQASHPFSDWMNLGPAEPYPFGYRDEAMTTEWGPRDYSLF